jgi:hypothetical protein
MYLKIILATFIFSIISSFCPFQKYPKKENDLISLLAQNTNVVYDSGFWSKRIEIFRNHEITHKTKTRDFVIKFHRDLGDNPDIITQFLEIDKRKVDLRNIFFWKTKQAGKVSAYSYNSPYNDNVLKFSIGKKQYISFETGHYPCNGSGCSISFYFLYDLETKKLYVFDLIGSIEFTDVNNDNILDLLVVAYEWYYPASPHKTTITAYTQDAKGTFRPITDTLGKTYEIKYNIKRNKDTDEEQGIKVTKWHWFFEP